MKYRLDAFNGNGKHETFLFPTEEKANEKARELHEKFPHYILFLLKETSISGMFDVVRMYNGKELE